MSETWSLYFFTYFNSLFPLISSRSLGISNLLDLAITALDALYSSSTYHHFLFEQAERQLEQAKIQSETIQALVILCWYCHLVGDAKKCGTFRRQVAQSLS
ncbi:hypothetical protein BY458DRAFT_471390 [Sporodiniella umbellata]|nr:hypothetical protein BY458DRAFT_471390 [Sporodiniella umbellata]